ncbi:MAG: DUF4293 domain-containing protein [Niabella sp.]
MIQRKQTLWLLLAVIATVLTFKFPFYNGIVVSGAKGVSGAELTATDNIPLMLLTGLTALLGLAGIFMFKDRKKQLMICFLGLLAAIGTIVLNYTYIKYFQSGSISITALLLLVTVIGFFFAMKGIRKDQKLIRSLDRLR